jgi:hypothetical protein
VVATDLVDPALVGSVKAGLVESVSYDPSPCTPYPDQTRHSPPIVPPLTGGDARPPSLFDSALSSSTALTTTLSPELRPAASDPRPPRINPRQAGTNPRALAARAEPSFLFSIAGGGQPRGSRLPDGFVVPEDWREEAAAARKEAGLARADLALEAVKFANYWPAQSGARGAKADWRKAWIVWALSENVKISNEPDPTPRASQYRTPSRPLSEEERNRILGVA